MSNTSSSSSFRPNSVVRSIPRYVFWELASLKQERISKGRKLLDLGIGSPDQPVPDLVVDAIHSAAERQDLGGYPPFRGHSDFLSAAAEYMSNRFGAETDPNTNYMAVAGSKEGIAELILSVCEPGDVVLVPEVYYPVYVRASQLAQAEPYLVRFDDRGMLDLASIPADIVKRSRILIANYPCNPTTATIDLPEMESLVSFASSNGILLVSDLAYAELAFGGYRPPSVFQVPGAMECAVELHSASKSFNMAGFRVGFVAGNKDVISALDAYRTNTGYGSASLPQIAAAAAFRNYSDIVPPIVAEYERRRDAALGAFRKEGWDVPTTRATMYLWLPLPSGFDDWNWVAYCMDTHGIVVTPGVAFGEAGRGRFRISLVQPANVLADACSIIAGSGRP